VVLCIRRVNLPIWWLMTTMTPARDERDCLAQGLGMLADHYVRLRGLLARSPLPAPMSHGHHSAKTVRRGWRVRSAPSKGGMMAEGTVRCCLLVPVEIVADQARPCDPLTEALDRVAEETRAVGWRLQGDPAVIILQAPARGSSRPGGHPAGGCRRAPGRGRHRGGYRRVGRHARLLTLVTDWAGSGLDEAVA
jgi:hypothetical protein